MRRFAGAASLICLFACQVESDLVGSIDKSIAGGEIALTSNDAVCGMRIVLPDDDDGPRDPIYCAGTHVAPGIVLTAGGCIKDNLDADALDDIDLRFGPGFDSSGQQFSVAEAVIHRYYTDETGFSHDLALLRLDSIPSAPLATLNTRELTSDDAADGDPCGTVDTGFAPAAGGCVTLIGYGETVDGEDDFGVQRRTVVPLTSITPLTVFTSDIAKQSCLGDSGAPAFMEFTAAEPVLVAVTASHPPECFDASLRTRVDAHLTDFIYPYIDRFGDTCALDTVCETECPRTSDPDCDPCAWNDSCEEDCPTRDWDCTLGSFGGKPCAKNGDCEEGGRCVAAADDASFTYCSVPCDLDAGDSCPNEMNCETSDGASECLWGTPSPGSQGFPCSIGGQCRSEICEETICVKECSGSDDCADPYVCGPSSVKDGATVCLGEIVSGGGGFCTPSSVAMRRGQSSPWGGLALLALAIVGVCFASRRRR